MSGLSIKNLFVYPIKSFRGVAVDSLQLDEAGPRGDRQFALIDAENRVITQRQRPELARIGLRLLEDSVIELSATDFGEMDFGMNERSSGEVSVSIWNDQVPAHEVDGEISKWISDVLKTEARLVRLSETARREFRSDDFPGRTTRFTDFGPLLVISTASLKDLEARAKVTLSMSRFRPNIVIDGATPYAEDGWPSFNVSGLEMKPLKACKRCKITTLHPLTGKGGDEPLKTLSAYRRAESGGVTFGYYYAHARPGLIKVGSPVTVGGD